MPFKAKAKNMQYEGKQHNWAMQTRQDEAQADTEQIYIDITLMWLKSFHLFL